jgi:hypothetical protein
MMTRIIRRQPLQRAHERLVDVLLIDGHVPLLEQLSVRSKSEHGIG